MEIGVSTIIDKVDYAEYSNSQLLVIPMGILLVGLITLVVWFFMTGAPVILGVEFVGGTELRVTPDDTQEDPFQDLNSNVFSSQPNSVQSIPADSSYIITFRGDSMDVDAATEQAESAGYTVQSSSTISASFGSGSQELALYGLLFAFIGMSVVVFGLFRSFIPSITVVASAFNVLVLPLAMMNLSGIELSFGTITALLMLLGYSVDSDMLLNDYVVRRGGEFYDAVYTAMDTGLTMTLTSILAMAVMAIISSFAGIPLLQDIGIIIVFGLVIDIMNTYMMNVTILRWYRFDKGGSR